MKKYKHLRVAFVALSIIIALTMMIAAFSSQPIFPDVPASHWAYKEAEYMAGQGGINGVGDGTFYPDGLVAFDQYFTMMARAFFKDEMEQYTSSDWWYAGMEIARAHIFFAQFIKHRFGDSILCCNFCFNNSTMLFRDGSEFSHKIHLLTSPK